MHFHITHNMEREGEKFIHLSAVCSSFTLRSVNFASLLGFAYVDSVLSPSTFHASGSRGKPEKERCMVQI